MNAEPPSAGRAVAAAEPARAPRAGLGLGTRVFLLVAGLNVVIFASAGLYLWERLSGEGDRLAIELTEELVGTLRASILPDGANVRNILDWPGWSEVEDAFLVDTNLVERSDGGLQARGIALHPVGWAPERATLDLDRVLDGLALGMRERRSVTVAEGRVVPIEVSGGVWGACWFRLRDRSDVRGALGLLLPWFAISTTLLTGGSFLALRRLVLEPVGRLAAGARRMSAGELEVSVATTGRGDELDALVGSFNGMARRVAGFNRELAERVAEATDQARRAEQAAMIQRRLAAMGELAAGIAHEINNPLGGLLNAVAALRRGDLPEERRERYLDLLSRGLERIRGTVGQVLRMAPREVRPTRVDLGHVVDDALALVRHRADAAGVELRVERELDAAARVLGSRNELGQALLNLLVNALDALEGDGRPEGRIPAGRITVRLERPRPGRLALSVVDDGPGVDAETLARAKDLFFSTKDPGRGTGLGLAIVHNVVDSHGGTLELASAPGAGFRAVLELPEAGPDEGRPAGAAGGEGGGR